MLILKNKTILFILLIGIFVILLFASKFQLKQEDENYVNVDIKNAICHVEKNTCSIENDIFKLKLKMDKKIRYLTLFNVAASSEVKGKFQIKKIRLDFKMKGMDMGVNQVLLKPGNLENNRQQWRGSGLLPICVSGRADWLAELEIYINQTRYRMQFPVVVHKIIK